MNEETWVVIVLMALYESILDAAVSSSGAQINHLSNDELKALLNDDDKIESMIKDLPQVKVSKRLICLGQIFDASSHF